MKMVVHITGQSGIPQKKVQVFFFISGGLSKEMCVQFYYRGFDATSDGRVLPQIIVGGP